MPTDLVEQVRSYLGLGGGGLGGYALWRARANKEQMDKMQALLDKLDDEDDRIKELLSEHKIYSANTYAKLEDVKSLISDLYADVKYLRQRFDEVLKK